MEIPVPATSQKPTLSDTPSATQFTEPTATLAGPQETQLAEPPVPETRAEAQPSDLRHGAKKTQAADGMPAGAGATATMTKNDRAGGREILLSERLLSASFTYHGVFRDTSAYLGSAEDNALKKAEQDAREWQKRISARLVTAYGSADGINRENKKMCFPDGSLTYERAPGPDEGPNTITVLLKNHLNFTSIPAFAMDIGFGESPVAISYVIDCDMPQEGWVELSKRADYELIGWDEGEITSKVCGVRLRISILETSIRVDVEPQGRFREKPNCQPAFGADAIISVLNGDPSPWKSK